MSAVQKFPRQEEVGRYSGSGNHTCQPSRVSLDCLGIWAFVQGSRDLVHLSRDFGIFECMVMVLQRVHACLYV